MTVMLEAKLSLWHLNGPSRPPMTIEAFGEPGKAPLMSTGGKEYGLSEDLLRDMGDWAATPLNFRLP